MSDIAVDFSEVDHLERDLRQAADDIDDDVDNELAKAARKLHAAATVAAPRRTGDLAASIYLRSGNGEHTVGSDLVQGFMQEFGTSRHPPQPWLFPAADRAGDELEEQIADVADPLT